MWGDFCFFSNDYIEEELFKTKQEAEAYMFSIIAKDYATKEFIDGDASIYDFCGNELSKIWRKV